MASVSAKKAYEREEKHKRLMHYQRKIENWKVEAVADPFFPFDERVRELIDAHPADEKEICGMVRG